MLAGQAAASLVQVRFSNQTHDDSDFPQGHFDPNLPHDSMGAELNVIIWPIFFIASILLLLRIMSKRKQERRLWWDDYILIIGWIALLGQTVCATVWTSLGLGAHFYDVPFENWSKSFHTSFFLSVFAYLSIALTKTSFAVTLMRIPVRWIRVAAWVAIITMNMAIAVSIIFIFTTCMLEAGPKKGEHCVPGQVMVKVDMFTGIYSGVLDITLALLPWTFIWKQEMRLKEKLGVGIAMSMGIFAGITAFVKSTYLPTVAEGDLMKVIPLTAWNVAESAVTIIAASIPVLRALLKQGNIQMPDGYMTDDEATLVSKLDRAAAKETLGISAQQFMSGRNSLEAPPRALKGYNGGFNFEFKTEGNMI